MPVCIPRAPHLPHPTCTPPTPPPFHHAPQPSIWVSGRLCSHPLAARQPWRSGYKLRTLVQDLVNGTVAESRRPVTLSDIRHVVASLLISFTVYPASHHEMQTVIGNSLPQTVEGLLQVMRPPSLACCGC